MTNLVLNDSEYTEFYGLSLDTTPTHVFFNTNLILNDSSILKIYGLSVDWWGTGVVIDFRVSSLISTEIQNSMACH